MTTTRRNAPKPDITQSDIPVPAAYFSSRRLLECNTLFAEIFLPVGEDASGGGLTIAAFAGDDNEALAKEFARLANSTEPVRSPVVREAVLPTREGPRRFLISTIPATYKDKRALRVIAQNITSYGERAVRAEEAEARYRIYVESTAAAIALVRDGLFVYVNKGLLDLFGYMFAEEMVAKDVTSFFPGRDRKAVAEYGHVGDGNSSHAPMLECTAIRKDNGRVNIQLRGEVIQVDDQPTMLWHCVDVSHLRQSEEAVERKARENEILERLLTAVHHSVDRVEVQRASLTASLRWLGYESGGLFLVSDEQKALILESEERLPPALSDKLRELPANEGLMGFLTKTMEPVRLAIEEYPAHLPYRGAFEAENVKALAFLPLVSGEHLAGILMLLTTKAHDVPAYHQGFLEIVARHLGFALHEATAYGQIQRRADALQDAIEQISGVVYVALPNGTFKYLSPVVERVVGFKIRELTATPDDWRAIVHPDDRSLAAERISRQAGIESEFVLEYRVLPKGKAAYIRVRDAVRYIRSTDGAVQIIYGLVTDVTQQTAARHEAVLAEIGKALEQSVDRDAIVTALSSRLAAGYPADLRMEQSIGTLLAAALDRVAPGADPETGGSASVSAGGFAADDLAHIVSHDLKEPLITIAGYAKLVRDGCAGVDDESREYLESVIRSSMHMKQLIEDLLSLLRVGRGIAHDAYVSPSGLLDDLMVELSFLIKERNARIEYPPDLPVVRYDSTALGIVFRNLIVNGVRHNTQAEPVVRVAARADECSITFSVSDNGVGIDAAHADRIFDLYERLHTNAGEPGSGIGLAIVKKMIEASGGTVWLESSPNAGSTFFFTVPVHG
jgi:PAS domain S-box-containing protein